jgi:hypothetical protein
MDFRFSNRPFGVKRFQTIHHYSVDVAHGLVLLYGIGTKALPSWDSKTGWNNLSRARQALDVTGIDRVGNNRENDWNGTGGLQQWCEASARMGQDGVRRERDQFRRVSANLSGIRRGRDVRYSVAIEGKADLARKCQNRRECRVGPGNFTPSLSQIRT